MFIILGATGHVGSAVATALLDKGKAVTVVTRDPKKGESWRGKGAVVAVAEVRDVQAMRDVFKKGTRAFLLNPPADPASDTDAEERGTVDAIVQAIAGSSLEKIVAHSTYGARPGSRCGDLSVLYEFEQKLRAQSIPVSVLRAAYYFSNWDYSLQSAKDEGVVHSMFPADFSLPMVAPADLGKEAARLLLGPIEDCAVHHVEGPRRYTPGDVAKVFSEKLGKRVEVKVSPREAWVDTFEKLGFSPAAAESYARMTAVTLDEKYYFLGEPVRGKTTLEEYIKQLAA